MKTIQSKYALSRNAVVLSFCLMYLSACDETQNQASTGRIETVPVESTQISDGSLLADGSIDEAMRDAVQTSRDGGDPIPLDASSTAPDNAQDSATLRVPDAGMNSTDSAYLVLDSSMLDAQASDQEVFAARAQVAVYASPPILGMAIQGESTAITCVFKDENGMLLDPADSTVDIASPQAEHVDGRWQFLEYGVYEARCRSASLGVEGTTKIIVEFDGVDHRFRDTLRASYAAAPLYRQLIYAFNAGDQEVVDDKLGTLRSLSSQFYELSQREWIADHPLERWPNEERLSASGLRSEPEDEVWLDALAQFRADLTVHAAFWNELDPATLDEAAVARMEDQIISLRSQAKRISTLPISPSTAWLQRNRLGEIQRDLLTLCARVHHLLLDYYSGPVPPAMENGFVGSEILGTLLVQTVFIVADEAFEEISYTQMLRNVAITAVASLTQVAIKDLLNLDLVVPDGGIRIDSLHGPAGGFIGAGNAFYGRGRFPSPLSANRLLIIPPRYSLFIGDVTNALESIEAIWTSPKIVLKAQEFQRVVNAIGRLLVAADDVQGVENFAEFIGIRPVQGDENLVYFPELPTGLNCNQFGLPVVGTVIPVHLAHGPGLAVNVNVYGENLSACEN